MHAPLAHTFVHPPQWFGSLVTSMQPCPQSSCPAGHVPVQTPLVHTPLGHELPHVPQLFGSLAGSMQP
jgi:hypothetical protein